MPIYELACAACESDFERPRHGSIWMTLLRMIVGMTLNWCAGCDRNRTRASTRIKRRFCNEHSARNRSVAGQS